MQRSLFLEHEENDQGERGCMEAVSAFLAAVVHDADKQDSERETAEGSSPALLQTSKGAGTIECLDSARELLRFFGHAPLLHLEGVIWVKTSGERGTNVPWVAVDTTPPGSTLKNHSLCSIYSDSTPNGGVGTVSLRADKI
ncbi:unnamed protein product [Ectocarpus sp. 13 AM-2016]